ncbi:hypothetical protein PoB_003817500 [Plakobranchus ocellatus]|uniref:Uncharacterized protein n=1 Tax=Plakobranchus ocellatus TaxID=259542 RepID=A0AAV4AXX7_9GAST|nr:hypothetical protein PoB_003817500 [Plakobranchus ocellatus]
MTERSQHQIPLTAHENDQKTNSAPTTNLFQIMDGLATWLGPGKVSDILAAVKDRDLWRDMIANAYKQGT